MGTPVSRRPRAMARPVGVPAPAISTGDRCRSAGLIGVLMVCIDQLGVHRLVRPFVGVGVLGGFTTFSTYVVEVQQAVAAGAARLALAYLGATLAAAVVAVWAGSALASSLIRVLTRAGRRGPKQR